MDINFKDMFGSMMPKNSRKRQVSVSEAREILAQEEAEKLIDVDAVVVEAVDRVENSGIVFLDEIDKEPTTYCSWPQARFTHLNHQI